MEINFKTSFNEETNDFELEYNDNQTSYKTELDDDEKTFNSSFKEVNEVVTNSYERIQHKPQIENVELIGNKSFEDLGMTEISNLEILEIANKILYGGK